jgi:superfamily I DNA and RNA helicase
MALVHLNDRLRDTIERIFSHSSSGNIEWRQVLSLLNAGGTTTEEHNGNVRVTLGPETEVLQPAVTSSAWT